MTRQTRNKVIGYSVLAAYFISASSLLGIWPAVITHAAGLTFMAVWAARLHPRSAAIIAGVLIGFIAVLLIEGPKASWLAMISVPVVGGVIGHQAARAFSLKDAPVPPWVRRW